MGNLLRGWPWQNMPFTPIHTLAFTMPQSILSLNSSNFVLQLFFGSFLTHPMHLPHSCKSSLSVHLHSFCQVTKPVCLTCCIAQFIPSFLTGTPNFHTHFHWFHYPSYSDHMIHLSCLNPSLWFIFHVHVGVSTVVLLCSAFILICYTGQHQIYCQQIFFLLI